MAASAHSNYQFVAIAHIEMMIGPANRVQSGHRWSWNDANWPARARSELPAEEIPTADCSNRFIRKLDSKRPFPQVFNLQ
jgi:hypothetical protein